MTGSDTIAAIATAPGRGAIGVLRLSGPRAAAIAQALFGSLPPPRRAVLRPFKDADGAVLDRGLVLFFPAPHSYTGEDVVEFQGHGGPVLMQLLLQRALALGARLAAPGEFTERAFLNDKLDLAQAEAVIDLIDAASASAARAAARSLEGGLSEQVAALDGALLELRAWLEAALDFPEEEIDFLADPELAARLAALRDRFAALRRRLEVGRVLRESLRLVIAGRPNAGKSRLLNALAGHDAAIVSDTPGTTRDVLRETLDLDGLPVTVLDTAGLRDSADPIEREGVRRALAAAREADRILLVLDDRDRDGDTLDALLARLPEGPPVDVVHNKIDLTGRPPGLRRDTAGRVHLWLSAATGAGLEHLVEHLKSVAGLDAAEDALIARTRHLDALDAARAALDRAAERLGEGAGELAAEELREAQRALGRITGGGDDPETLLGEIFGRFCIGK